MKMGGKNVNKIVAVILVVLMALVLLGGCAGGNGIVSEGESLKIGVPGPYSGGGAAQGANLRYGIEQAAIEINEEGGILGRKIELIFADTEAKPEVGVSAYEKLITLDEVDFIVGEVNSHVALAVLDVVAGYQIPTIFSIPASDELGEKVKSDPNKFGCVFMIDPPTSKMYEGTFHWLDDIIKTGQWQPANKTLVLINEDADFGRTVIAMWEAEMTKRGWEIVLHEITTFDEVEFTPLLTRVKNLNPDLVKIEMTSVTSGVAITRQINEAGIKALIFGGYYQKIREFPELAGEMANYSLNIREPYPKSWEKKIQETFPAADPIASMYSYDSLYILKEAIERAGSFDWKEIIEALKLTDYEGIFMRTVFSPETHFPMVGPEYKFYGVGQYMDGELKLLYPYDYKEKEFKLPY